MTNHDEAGRLTHLGWRMLQSGKAHEAEQHFRQALTLNANSAAALHGLAIIAHRTANFEAALALFDRALTAANNDAGRPELAAVHVNRGTTLVAMQRFSDAIAAFVSALQISPQLPSALVNMATALHATRRLDEAVEALERATAMMPEGAEPLNNLGNLYKDQGRLAEAVDCYERALKINPMVQQAFSNKLAALKVDAQVSPAEILRQHQEWSRWFEAVSENAPLLRNSAEPDRRLRIGYVSPDCHTAVPAFLDPVIAAHDREKFDVFCYFNHPQAPQKLNALGVAETSRLMRGGDDEKVAQLIHRDGIDILIDIAGHTGHNRLGVFARRPAPVQITWLDYLCTTGLAAMDYRITDAVADPPGSEAFHSEKLLRLPDTQWCWQADAAAPAVGTLPAARNGWITFGSFNNAQKLSDATLALWRRLLAAMPASKLCVAGIPEGRARARVLAGLSCDESRVQFLPRLEVAEYRRAFDGVDIVLDPMPFSGATTTLDALWQGVPVLTLPGATSCSRSTASLLTALELQDWIASDSDDFLRRAQRLSRDVPALAALRESLRDRLSASAIFGTASFTRNLEAAYRRAWQTWCTERAVANGRPDCMAGSHDALIAASTAVNERRTDDALTILSSLLRLRPQWELAKREMVRACLAWSREHPEAKAAWKQPVPVQEKRTKVSAIICSIRPDYFAHIKNKLAAQFAAHDFEVIGIHDAKSLCEGYNRGAQQAAGDILIFCHDDIDIVHTDFGERLLRHLVSHEVVGVVGTSKLVNAEWAAIGMPHVHGQIIHKPTGEAEYRYFCVGLQAPVVSEIQALDGVFIAMHRRVWETLRYDETRFDGFHVYDIDFTYRAYLAGFRIAVAMDLLLVHFSSGGYDLKWQKYNRRFLEKFPALTNLPGPAGIPNIHVRLRALEDVERLHTGLLHHNFGALNSAG